MAENLGSPLLRRHLIIPKKLEKSPRNINSLRGQHDIISEQESDGSESEFEIKIESRTDFKNRKTFPENLVNKNKNQASPGENASKEKHTSPASLSSTANLNATSRDNNYSWRLIISLIVLVAAGSIYYCSVRDSNLQTYDKTENHAIEVFENQLNTLQVKFPNFNKKTWKTILAVVRTTLSNRPTKTPGVITIMAPTKAKKLANCLGKKLANLLQTAFNDSDYVNLKGEAYSDQEPSKAKLKMDNAIRDGFEKKNQHVVLFENLQAIPPASSTLFHGLCDNENAPFKQAIYIFTVENNDDGQLKDETITTVWTDQLDVDILSSLESRIGNNVVVVNREASTDGENICN